MGNNIRRNNECNRTLNKIYQSAMLKIPSRLLEELKSLYCKTTDRDGVRAWCNQKMEPIDSNTFGFLDEVKFCRYLKDNPLPDISNETKELARLNDECKVILAKHNLSKNLHREDYTSLSSVGLFLMASGDNNLSEIWTAGINEWKAARIDGFNFLRSGIMAATAFYKAWNLHSTPQPGAESDFIESKYRTSTTNGSLLLEQANTLKQSLMDFAEAMANVSVGPPHKAHTHNYSELDLNSSDLVEMLEESDLDILLDSMGNEPTYTAIKNINSSYDQLIYGHILPIIVGQFRELRTAINGKNKRDIENSVAKIESTGDRILTIDNLFIKYSQNLINTIRQAEWMTSFSAPKASVHLQELRNNLTLTEFPNTAKKLRSVLTSVINIRLLLNSNISANNINALFDSIDNFAQEEDIIVDSHEFAGNDAKASLKKIKLLIASLDDIQSGISSETDVDFQAADNYLDITMLRSLLDDLRKETSYLAIIDILSSESTHRTIQQLNNHYSDWALDYMIPEIVSQARQLRLAFQSKNTERIESNLAIFDIVINDLNLMGKRFYTFIHRFEIVSKDALEKSSANNLTILNQELTSLRGILHDINNLLTTSFSISTLHQAGLDFSEFEYAFDSIDSFDLTTLSSNIRTAVKFQSHAANKKMVNVTVGDNMPIVENMPNDIKHLVLRMVSESILNSIKYSDDKKTHKKVTVSVTQDGQLIDIVIKDNGVGISDVTRVLELGGRERPDLADGTGTGLTALSNLANKMGLKLSVESTPGVGTTVSLKGINPSKWASLTPSEVNTHENQVAVNDHSTMASSSFEGFISDNELVFQQHGITDDETSINPLNPSTVPLLSETQLNIFGIQPVATSVTITKVAKPIR